MLLCFSIDGDCYSYEEKDMSIFFLGGYYIDIQEKQKNMKVE